MTVNLLSSMVVLDAGSPRINISLYLLACSHHAGLLVFDKSSRGRYTDTKGADDCMNASRGVRIERDESGGQVMDYEKT